MAGRKKKRRPAGGITDGLAAFEATLDKALEVAERNPDALEGMHERQGNPITLGPRVAEADEWAEKQLTNAQAAGERWLANVLRPRKDPLTAALGAKGKYKNRVEESIREDRWAKGIAAVDEDEMFATITEGGAAPFVSGVQRRARKVRRVVGQLRPMVVALAETIDKMPIDTDAQREARLLAARRGMIAIGKKRKGIA